MGRVHACCPYTPYCKRGLEIVLHTEAPPGGQVRPAVHAAVQYLPPMPLHVDTHVLGDTAQALKLSSQLVHVRYIHQRCKRMPGHDFLQRKSHGDRWLWGSEGGIEENG